MNDFEKMIKILEDAGPLGRRKIAGETGLHESTLNRILIGITSPRWKTIELILKYQVKK